MKKVSVPAALAVIAAALAVVAALEPAWIERLFVWEPDAGNGSAEWGLVAGFAGASVVLAALASRRWHRGRHERSAARGWNPG